VSSRGFALDHLKVTQLVHLLKIKVNCDIFVADVVAILALVLERDRKALDHSATVLLQPICKVLCSSIVMGQCEVDVFAGCCSCCLPSTPSECTAA
jgi:hypothetical protein